LLHITRHINLFDLKRARYPSDDLLEIQEKADGLCRRGAKECLIPLDWYLNRHYIC
jgi:hypothetical protein